MNYYQIQPVGYIDKLIENELYQKCGAFQNFWRLFSKYYLKGDLQTITDENIVHFKNRYSKRTLAKIFNVKSKDTAGKWKDEFIEVIENFVAYWKLKNEKNDLQDSYTLKQGSHSLATKQPESSQMIANEQPTSSQALATPLATKESDETITNKGLKEGQKNSISHLDSQEVANEQPESSQMIANEQPESSHEVAKYINNKIINNKNKKIKKINNKWIFEFFQWLSTFSKSFASKRNEFEVTFMSLFSLYDDVEEVITWASKNDFWIDKLLDAKSIKRNYEKMRLQYLKEKNRKSIPNSDDKVELIKKEIEMAKEIERKMRLKGVVI